MASTTGMPAGTYVPADDALSRQVGGETVIINLATEEYFGLNAVGSVLWTGLEEGLPVDAIVDRVVERFDVGRERAAHDLGALLASLAEAGLVRRAETGRP